MASTHRRAADRVNFFHALHARPTTFDFHVAMRRLECLHPELPRWGEAQKPAAEPIRLGQEPSTAFPNSVLASFRLPTENEPGSLWVRFFGLLGPHGPLPLHLTEYVRERLRHRGDRTLSAFLNIFHHRMLALFHRAWSVAQPTAQGDRPGENRFDDYVGSIIGIALPALRQRDVITDAAKLQYAGLLACPSRNREGLCAILAHYFGHPVRVEEFVGEWLSLPDSARWRLGVSEEVSSLGRTSVLGARTWRCDHKFRVVVGPLASDEFRSLLPGNPRLERLAALVRTYTGDEFEWDVKLVLAEGASRQVKLGRGDRLGLYTQLGRTKRTARRDDVIIHPVSHRTQRSARKHHD